MTPAELRAKLEALGTTAYEVADTLRDKGIRAVNGDLWCESCPVAQYLGGDVAVGPKDAVVFLAGPDGGSFRVLLPDAVSEFVRRYDSGDFPDLAPEGAC